MKKTLFTITLFLTGAAWSQVKVTELYLQSGSYFGQGNGSLADFHKLAPQSSILNQDLSLYETTAFFFPLPSSSQSLSAGLKLAKLPNATLRVGLTHIGQGSALRTAGDYIENFVIDTLTSAQTGQQVYVDSTSVHSYFANYSQEQLRLDASLIFRLKGEKRWSVYGGLGINFGLSYNAHTTIRSSVSPYYTSQMSVLDQLLLSYHGDTQEEVFDNKGGYGLALYAPLGLDFQVGKKRDFWKPFHLYSEFRPGININQIACVGTTFSVGGFSNFGLRVKFK
jgi:hypothetical protein